MPWSTLATNQCVSLNNLRDAVANGIFVAISAIPSGTKQITKTEALAYVDIQTSPLASKASNQLVVKNNLSAKVYTYDRYDLSPTTCTTNNPIPFWSYLDIPYGSYNLNGTGSLYQIIPTTHTTFTNQITSYVSVICTPVIQYTYLRYDLNLTNCTTSNPIQFWSYLNLTNGNYTINGGGSIYSIQASSHSNFSNEITSANVASCTGEVRYTYIYYTFNPCTCALTYGGQFYSNESKTTGYYYLIAPNTQTFEIYVAPDTHTNYSLYLSFTGVSPGCVPKCKTFIFYNSNPFGFNLNETFTYIECFTMDPKSLTLAPYASTTRCVESYTIPPAGNRGDYPYTFDECCT